MSTGILNISDKCNNELMLVEVSKRTLQISERGQLEDAKKKTTESTASQVYVRTDLSSVGRCVVVVELCYKLSLPLLLFSPQLCVWLGRPDDRTGIWMPDVTASALRTFRINHAELRTVALLNHTG